MAGVGIKITWMRSIPTSLKMDIFEIKHSKCNPCTANASAFFVPILQSSIPPSTWALYTNPYKEMSIILSQTLTDSSSFSIPVGIWGTARLIVLNSDKSGNSSAWYTGRALLASSWRALNDNLLIFDDSFHRKRHSKLEIYNTAQIMQDRNNVRSLYFECCSKTFYGY